MIMLNKISNAQSLKVLLIRPSMRFLPGRKWDMIDLPLGLLYIGASLEKHGYNVTLIDSVMPESDYKHIQDAENHFGITFEDMERRIRALFPLPSREREQF